MSETRVFVVDRQLEPFMERIRARFPHVQFEGVSDPEGFPGRELDCDVLLTWWFRSEWIPRMPRLRWIQCGGAGVDRVAFAPGLPDHLSLTRMHGNFGRQMAEYALSALMHHVAGWPLWEAQQRKRDWRRPPRRLARDATAGVMGLGVIGGETAELLRAAGFEVWGCSRSGAPHGACARVFAESGLDEFLAGLDYLVLVLPLTPATRGLLDERRLGLLEPGAVLVNIARAAIVNEGALVKALDSGRLASCYLDVFWDEPLPPSSPWWSRERVFISPHIAGMTEVADLVNEFSANLERYLKGQPLRSLVDRARGY